MTKKVYVPQIFEMNHRFINSEVTLQTTYPPLSLGGDYRAAGASGGGRGGSTWRAEAGDLEQSEKPQSIKLLGCQGDKTYRKRWDHTQNKFLLL